MKVGDRKWRASEREIPLIASLRINNCEWPNNRLWCTPSQYETWNFVVEMHTEQSLCHRLMCAVAYYARVCAIMMSRVLLLPLRKKIMRRLLKNFVNRVSSIYALSTCVCVWERALWLCCSCVRSKTLNIDFSLLSPHSLKK